MGFESDRVADLPLAGHGRRLDREQLRVRQPLEEGVAVVCGEAEYLAHAARARRDEGVFRTMGDAEVVRPAPLELQDRLGEDEAPHLIRQGGGEVGWAGGGEALGRPQGGEKLGGVRCRRG